MSYAMPLYSGSLFCFLGRRKTRLSVAFQWLESVWDVDSLDWQELSADEITRRVTSKVQPGSIILFHNAALHTPEALLQQDYTFVPISQIILFGDTTPITPSTTPAASAPMADHFSARPKRP